MMAGGVFVCALLLTGCKKEDREKETIVKSEGQMEGFLSALKARRW